MVICMLFSLVAALVSSLGFRYSNSLLFFQMIFCVTLFQTLRWLRLIEFRHPLPSPTPSLSSNMIPNLSPHLQQWFTFFMKLAPISIFYMLNAGCGMLSLQGLSLPMFSVLKRFTPIIVAVIEYVLWKRTTTRMVTMSLLLCASGFILAGLGDLVFDFGAYTLAIASCVSQALYLINVDKVGKELSLTSHELLYYNSLISLFLLAPFVWLTGELHASLFIYDGWSNPTFLIGLIVMLALGTSLNYFQFLCTQGQEKKGETYIYRERESFRGVAFFAARVCLTDPQCVLFAVLSFVCSEFSVDDLHGWCHERHTHHDRGILHGHHPSTHILDHGDTIYISIVTDISRVCFLFSLPFSSSAVSPSLCLTCLASS